MTTLDNWTNNTCIDMEQTDSSITIEEKQTELDIEPTYDELRKELEFYKSLFETHSNSCVFNLSIKKKKCNNVWVDHVRDPHSYLSSLDKDDEVRGWLKPTKPSR
jgi:hypothetical protein